MCLKSFLVAGVEALVERQPAELLFLEGEEAVLEATHLWPTQTQT
jgi:hypothetical protein